MYDRGDGVYVFCQCRKQRVIERRIKSSMIGPAFISATFDNYKPVAHTNTMYQTVKEYTTNFKQIKSKRSNGVGLLAVQGESKFNSITDLGRRATMKQQHNSYGLGKTHLLSAMAMYLLKDYVQVLMVNDADIVAELRQGQFAKEEDKFEKLMTSVEKAELLIWDDLGKAKTTEWVLNQYYRIINYRYRHGLPICFSTNEDPDTLAEKIGDAAASRLFAICRDRLITVEGPDFRLR
jgi:DNA replication protein DnaC